MSCFCAQDAGRQNIFLISPQYLNANCPQLREDRVNACKSAGQMFSPLRCIATCLQCGSYPCESGSANFKMYGRLSGDWCACDTFYLVG